MTQQEQIWQDVMELANRPGTFTHGLGLHVTGIGDGWAEGELTAGDGMLNPLGIVHGGVYAAMMDHVAGTAACSRGNARLLFCSLSRGGGGFLGLGGSFGAGCGLLCLLGSGGGKALHILKTLGHRLPHLNAPLCLADVVDIFFKSFVHRLFTSVGSS